MAAPRTVLGHYTLGPELGAGGMGRVFEGTDLRDGSRVAIKFLHAGLLQADPGYRERFEREAHVAALLRSPYTVHLLDYGIADGAPCMVMEFVEGASVGTLLSQGTLPARQAARIARDCARALEEARARGVVHRDIKPENILVTPSGMARVADFGIARQEAADGATAVGAFVGTAAFAAPEQLTGEAEHRSDLFALGATLYTMLTGRPPLGSAGVRTLAAGRPVSVSYDGVPEPLANIVRRCLERDPRDRYHSADDLAGALDRSLALLDQYAPPEPAPRAAPTGIPSTEAATAAIAAASAPVAPGETAIETRVPIAEPPAASNPPPVATVERPVSESSGIGKRRWPFVAVGAAAIAGLAALAVIVATSGGGSDSHATTNPPSSPAASPGATPPDSPATLAAAAASPSGTAQSAAPTPVPATNEALAPTQPPAPATPMPLAPTPVPPTATPVPPTATPVPPTPTPAPGYPARSIASGEWNYTFTVTSTSAACAGDPPVGKTFPTESYVFNEPVSPARGYILDGETVSVSDPGGSPYASAVLRWPTLEVDYSIDNGTASLYNTFTGPENGTGVLVETYNDGCVVQLEDHS